MNAQLRTERTAPGANLDTDKMPGHWLLARMGKRVLRPGGLELTHRMLEALAISPSDHVIEFAPGLGVTTQLTISRQPAAYTAIEHDPAAAARVRAHLRPPHQCLVGKAEQSGLPDEAATAVYGEALLTMQTPSKKARIVGEANRLLKSGGRYGVHELCLLPDDLSDAKKAEVERALSKAVRVGARPLTPSEWRGLLETGGFVVQAQKTAPMHLLKFNRFVQDEGVLGTVRFCWNVLRNRRALARVLHMRRVFQHYQDHLAGMTLVAVKADGQT